MKSILAVTKLISRQKIRKLDVLTEEALNAKSSKFRDLYDALQDGSIRNDRDAAAFLYDAESTDPRYRQLKSRFRKRLLNTLFFVDQSRPHRSSYDQTFHNCQRDWSLINILRANEAIEPASEMAKSLLTCCQKYNFSGLTIQVARFLANLAADGNETKQRLELEQIINEARTSFLKELESEQLLRELKTVCLQISPWRIPTPQEEAQLDNLTSQIDEVQACADSPIACYDQFEAHCIRNASLHNWQLVSNSVEEALAYSDTTSRQMHTLRVSDFHRMQVIAQANLGLELPEETPLAMLSQKHKLGTAAYDEAQRYACLLSINQNKDLEAFQIALAMSSSRWYTELTAPEKEVWQLIQGLSYVRHLHNGGSTMQVDGFDKAGFMRQAATIGGGHHRLNSWRIIIQAAIHKQDQSATELSASVLAYRDLAIRKLDSTADSLYISLALVLYRVERNNFSPYLDRVAERHYGDLATGRPALSVNAATFEPLAPIGLLPVFGVSAMSGALVS